MDSITLVAGAVLGFGALLELLGIALLLRRFTSARHMRTAEAVVVATELYRSPRGVLDHHLHRPTVRFSTERGQQVDYTPGHYSNLYGHPVGARIRVQYDPDRPDRVVLSDPRSLRHWIPAIVCIGAGVVMMLAALVMSVAFGDVFGLL